MLAKTQHVQMNGQPLTMRCSCQPQDRMYDNRSLCCFLCCRCNDHHLTSLYPSISACLSEVNLLSMQSNTMLEGLDIWSSVHTRVCYIRGQLAPIVLPGRLLLLFSLPRADLETWCCCCEAAWACPLIRVSAWGRWSRRCFKTTLYIRFREPSSIADIMLWVQLHEIRHCEVHVSLSVSECTLSCVFDILQLRGTVAQAYKCSECSLRMLHCHHMHDNSAPYI